MEKASDYHRDIYVGMVAEELNQAGYFGDAYRLYGYLRWTEGALQLVCTTTEAECANQFLQHWREGGLLSPYLSCGQRLDGGEEAVLERLRVQLEQQLHIAMPPACVSWQQNQRPVWPSQLPFSCWSAIGSRCPPRSAHCVSQCSRGSCVSWQAEGI